MKKKERRQGGCRAKENKTHRGSTQESRESTPISEPTTRDGTKRVTSQEKKGISKVRGDEETVVVVIVMVRKWAVTVCDVHKLCNKG